MAHFINKTSPTKSYPWNRTAPETEQSIIHAYQINQSITEVGRLFQLGPSTVARILHRHKIKCRNYSDARRVYTLNQSFFGAIDTEQKAYWLGYIAADGCVMPKKNHLVVVSSERDKSHLEKLAASLSYSGPVLTYDSSFGKRCSRLTICSAQIVSSLCRVGIRPRKSFTVKPWLGNWEMMRHYWRGVVDGDGCISKSDGYWHLSVAGSRFMARGFLDFISVLTGVPTKKSPYRHGSIWVARCPMALTVSVVAALYENCTTSLDRKLSKANQLLTEKRRS